MWIGLKCKNTTDGLEGRPLICTENRGRRKIPQIIKQNIVTWKNWQQLCSLSLLLVTTEFQHFQQKKKNNTNATGGFMSSVSRGPANQAVYFLKYFYPRATRKCSRSVVLDVGLATLMYQSNRSLMILPGHLNFWPGFECLNSPLPGIKSHSNTPFYVRFRWSNSPT